MMAFTGVMIWTNFGLSLATFIIVILILGELRDKIQGSEQTSNQKVIE